MNPLGELFTGSGKPREDQEDMAWTSLPDPPPWRRIRGRVPSIPNFETTVGLLRAVNAALALRRPLLLTGAPGSGKSTLVELIAAELQLGEVLRWHITSRTILEEGLFSYDALGRLYAVERKNVAAGRNQPSPKRSVERPDSPKKHQDAAVRRERVEDYLTLGPLGTALASTDRPRALLVDEIDKSDVDLPGDLLNVIEEGSFEIPVLLQEAARRSLSIRGSDGAKYKVSFGRVQVTHLPVMVLTSNGERAFPKAFLRRCIRYTMPTPTSEFVAAVVTRYFPEDTPQEYLESITAFVDDVRAGKTVAIDQLLNLIHLVEGSGRIDDKSREALQELILRPLSER